MVNVVPVIAKSDSLTLEERNAFKQRINAELAFHNIDLYPYDTTEDYDDEERALNASIRVSVYTFISMIFNILIFIL